VLLSLVLAAAAVALAVLPTGFGPGERAVADTIIGSLVTGLVFAVPFFENRRMLEPRQFAVFPASAAGIAVSLLVTTVVSWPFLLLAVWLVSLGATRPEWGDPAWLAPVVLALVAVFAVCGVRVTAALSKLVAGTRYAGLLRTIGVVLLIAALPLAVYVGATAFGPAGGTAMADAARTLGWTPFGAPFAALAADGIDAAMPHLAVLVGAIAVLLAAWFPIVAVSNRRIERPFSSTTARSGLGWFERFAARPAHVIAARELTYWSRDPRYRVSLFAIPIAPIVMLVAFWVAGADLRSLALLPLPIILLLLAWSQHNDVAMDSTAIWMHVASGTKGRDDRTGRLAPVIMIGVPLALIGSSLTVTVLGDWRVLPAVVGMNVAVLLVGCGVSSVSSVVMPYPATRPGDSPFVQPQGSGSGSGVAQTTSILATLVLAVPPVWFSVVAILDVELVQNLWALLFGVVYGVAVAGLGILVGGRLFDRSGPELVAVTQVFD